MNLAQAALPLFYGLFIVLCGPPVISLWLCFRRLRHVQKRGGNGRYYTAGMAFSALCLIVNFGVLVITGLTMANDSMTLGPLHAAAAALAWLCLWLWISLLFIRRPRSRSAHF